MTLHTDGLQGTDTSQVHINDGDVSDHAIYQALEAFWEEHLITPDAIQKGQRRFWGDSTKGHPIPDTESAIQQFVHVGLTMRFWWCRVRQEQTGKIGRTDLEIVETAALQGHTVHHAVLELKVLRSFDSSGNKVPHAANAEAISKGLGQAEEYGTDKNTTHKILSCFDMRDVNVGQAKTFENIAEDAAKLKVHTWQWFMYRSSHDLRKARTAAKLAANGNG